MMQLQEQTALVTGASRGIGRAVAERLGRAGARVLGTATGEAGAAAITEHLAATGGRGLVLDLGAPDSVDGLLAELKAQDGPVTLLVNNAAVVRDNIALRMKDAQWDTVLRTNLDGVFRLTRGCLRGMLQARYGRIVSLSSVVAGMGNPGQSNYAAAKAGLEGFSRALAAELAGRNITVNCVAPGFIATDMTAALQDEQKSALLARIPARRFGEPREVAELVGFLCSAEAGYITGETVHINGGMYMR